MAAVGENQMAIDSRGDPVVDVRVREILRPVQQVLLLATFSGLPRLYEVDGLFAPII